MPPETSNLTPAVSYLSVASGPLHTLFLCWDRTPARPPPSLILEVPDITLPGPGPGPHHVLGSSFSPLPEHPPEGDDVAPDLGPKVSGAQGGGMGYPWKGSLPRNHFPCDILALKTTGYQHPGVLVRRVTIRRKTTFPSHLCSK